MVGFLKSYYDNIPNEHILSNGLVLDIKNHRNSPCSQKYKVGDKLIILPEWDGRNWASFKEMMELHEQGEIGEIIELRNPYIILGEKTKQRTHYSELLIKTSSKTFGSSVAYYRLGYKINLSNKV